MENSAIMDRYEDEIKDWEEDWEEDWKQDVIRDFNDLRGEMKFSTPHKSKVDDDSVEKIIADINQLKAESDPEDFPPILGCQEAKIVNLQECNLITDAALMMIGNHCRNLTELRVSYCNEVTDTGIVAVLKSIRTIRNLDFSFCKKATSASIDAVIKYCPKIATIFANSVGLVSLPENIGILSELKIFDLMNNSITTLPLSVGKLQENCSFCIANNPIDNVPRSVLRGHSTDDKQNPGRTIIRFFSDALKGATESNQFKMVLLGTGKAGKTSLLNALIGLDNPLTTDCQRTIHVEIREFDMERENGLPSIKIKAYDFGGQETYALGQSQYFDDNGIYILVINADETNQQVFIAHLQRLQAMAPNAMVLVVLSKSDMLKTEEGALQKKVKWIQDAITQFNEQAEASSLKHDHTRRLIPTKIITLTVQDEPAKAKMHILNAIQNLLDTQSSMFRSVGMRLPFSWLEFMSFVEAMSKYGPDDHQSLDKRMKELTKRDLELTSDAITAVGAKKDKNAIEDTLKSPSFAPFDGSPSEESEKKRLCWILALCCFLQKWCKKDDIVKGNHIKQRHGSPSISINSRAEASEVDQEKKMNGSVLTDNGYTDTANSNLKGYDGAPFPYIRRENLEKAWISYYGRQDTDKKGDEIVNILNDVLDLMKAQGDIIIYGTLVFLDPTFSASVMKALTDHRMTIDMVESPEVATEFHRYLEKPSCKLDYGSFVDSFKNFINHGKLNLDVLQYLFRYLPIDIDDYDRIIHMLVETFAIFLSLKELGATLNGPKETPVVLFHLPNEPDFKTIQKRWPSDYSRDVHHHFEVHFKFPLGCPASLAGHFAASLHALGVCISAHINGALMLGENRSLIYARLEKVNGKTGDYLSLAIRSRNENLDNIDKRNIWQMVNFLEIEKKEKYPGLIYAKKVLCPHCIKQTGEESAYNWNHEDGDSSILCKSCEEKFNPKEMFGDRSSCMETQCVDTVNPPQKNAASQVVAHILGFALLSARFKGDVNEDRARELAKELNEIGVNVYMVDSGPGERYGDKTNFALTHMKVMICFGTSNYGERTASVYSSCGELLYAHQNEIPLLPIKMCPEWPPKPPDDYDGKGTQGADQNKVAFRKDLLYLDWYERDWNAKECAKEVKASLKKMGECPMKS